MPWLVTQRLGMPAKSNRRPGPQRGAQVHLRPHDEGIGIEPDDQLETDLQRLSDEDDLVPDGLPFELHVSPDGPERQIMPRGISAVPRNTQIQQFSVIAA